MGLTNIAWTDYSFNAWWGCAKVSPACDFCYAEALSKRYGFDIWGSRAPRRTFNVNGDHWQEPLLWDRKAKAAGQRRRVFLNSMSDFLEDRPDLRTWQLATFDLIGETPNLTWLMLTKRPENARLLLPESWFGGGGWPENVWFGFTAENQEWYDRRIVHAAKVPAPVLFVSCEPLLGPINLGACEGFPNWVIVGGESGHKRREMDLGWALYLRAQARVYGAAFFMKQDSALRPGQRGRIPDELWIREFPA